MGYDEWLAPIKNPELYILVKNSTEGASPRDIVEKAKQALIEKQSLFTMQAK